MPSSRASEREEGSATPGAKRPERTASRSCSSSWTRSGAPPRSTRTSSSSALLTAARSAPRAGNWPSPSCSNWFFSSNQLQHTLPRMSDTLRGSLLAATALALVGSLVAASDLVEGYPLAAGQGLRYSAAGLALLAVAPGRPPRPRPPGLGGVVAPPAPRPRPFQPFVVEGGRE